MSIWRWVDYFSAIPPSAQLSLGEGNTPLVKSRRIGPRSGLENLYFKLETSNPSGSYKDRFAAAALGDMLANGKQRVIATSSGNTGSALAAYCAAAGVTCEIAIVDGAPCGKLTQMMAYGAEIYMIEGFGISPQVTDQVIHYLERLAAQPGNALQISAYKFSPAGMAGVQTIGYELAEQAGHAGHRIDHVFVPAGGGGLTLAVARGFADLVERSECDSSPAIHCVQPEGNNTIAGPLRDGRDRAQAVTSASMISGLQVGSVIDGDAVIRACREAAGTGHLVDDPAVWAMQRRLVREEGVFCEPAGAVALCGALQAVVHGEIGGNDHIVCLVTGSGFKDAAAIDRMIANDICPTQKVAALAARVDAT